MNTLCYQNHVHTYGNRAKETYAYVYKERERERERESVGSTPIRGHASSDDKARGDSKLFFEQRTKAKHSRLVLGSRHAGNTNETGKCEPRTCA